MTSSQLTELKQFFVQELHQAIGGLRQELLHEIGQLRQEMYVGLDSVRNDLRDEIAGVRLEIAELRQETHDGFVGVGEAIDYIHAQSDKRDLLITKLNKKWRKG